MPNPSGKSDDPIFNMTFKKHLTNRGGKLDLADFQPAPIHGGKERE